MMMVKTSRVLLVVMFIYVDAHLHGQESSKRKLPIQQSVLSIDPIISNVKKYLKRG